MIQNYKADNLYRLSLNRLTNRVFDFNLERWYQKGFWTDRYIPYSYAINDEIIANVSVNKMELVIDGKSKSAIQFGTVMTHPDYRGRGLSASLMNFVLEKYQNNTDIFYLFANKNVLEFYPKFGFEIYKESQFTVDVSKYKYKKEGQVRKLDPSNPEVLRQIYKMSSVRKPVSRVFGVENAQDLIMFYSLYVFDDCLYYNKKENVVVIYKKEDDLLHIYDIISPVVIDFNQVISSIIDEEVSKLVFYFTPDLLPVKTASSPLLDENDILFVKGNLFELKKEFRSPITAHI